MTYEGRKEIVYLMTHSTHGFQWLYQHMTYEGRKEMVYLMTHSTHSFQWLYQHMTFEGRKEMVYLMTQSTHFTYSKGPLRHRALTSLMAKILLENIY